MKTAHLRVISRSTVNIAIFYDLRRQVLSDSCHVGGLVLASAVLTVGRFAIERDSNGCSGTIMLSTQFIIQPRFGRLLYYSVASQKYLSQLGFVLRRVARLLNLF